MTREIQATNFGADARQPGFSGRAELGPAGRGIRIAREGCNPSRRYAAVHCAPRARQPVFHFGQWDDALAEIVLAVGCPGPDYQPLLVYG